MRVQASIGIASLLHLYGLVCAFPVDQQPLQANGSPDAQTVQAA